MSVKETVQRFFGRRLNEKGQEVPDPTPVALPAGYKHPAPLEARIQALIRDQLSRHAAEDGLETFEEANDFNVDDESDDRLFRDEDELIAANDPNVERAFQEEAPVVRERLNKHRAAMASKMGSEEGSPRPGHKTSKRPSAEPAGGKGGPDALENGDEGAED